MAFVEVCIQNKSGLHARPAAQFVAEAGKFVSQISVKTKTDKEANAKSIMGILSLGICKDTVLEIHAEGEDSNQAVERLKAFIENEIGD